MNETTRKLTTELHTFISQLEFCLALLTFAGRCHHSYNLLTHQYAFPIVAHNCLLAKGQLAKNYSGTFSADD